MPILKRCRQWSVPSLFLLSIAASAIGDESWTRFRGPNGNGLASAIDFPLAWAADDYNWRIELPGKGHSSPAVWGDYLIVQSADEENSTHHVICVNASDGASVWKKSFPGTPYRIHSKNSFASASPAVDEQRAYVAWSTAESATLAAFDKSGDVAWRKDFGPYAARHGFGSSPMLIDDLVILALLQHNGIPQGEPGSESTPETSFIVALDHETGEERWRTPRLSSSSASYSVPCIYSGRGPTELVCCSTADGMFGLDPKTGKVNWEIDVFEKRTVSSPLVAGKFLLGSAGSGGGGNYVVAVDPASAVTARTQEPSGDGPVPQVAYRIAKQAPYVPTPVVDGDLTYLWSDKGIVTCIETHSGNVVWRERVGGNFSGSPILVGNRLLAVAEDGEVVILAAGQEYKLLGRVPLGEPSNATPAVGHGCIYFRTLAHLMSLGPG